MLAKESNSIIIGLDKFRFPMMPDKEEHYFNTTLEWISANINWVFANNATPAVIKGKVFPDISSLGISLMSHSASGHTLASYLNISSIHRQNFSASYTGQFFAHNFSVIDSDWFFKSVLINYYNESIMSCL
jgi:hypothetical protein